MMTSVVNFAWECIHLIPRQKVVFNKSSGFWHLRIFLYLPPWESVLLCCLLQCRLRISLLILLSRGKKEGLSDIGEKWDELCWKVTNFHRPGDQCKDLSSKKQSPTYLRAPTTLLRIISRQLFFCGRFRSAWRIFPRQWWSSATGCCLAGNDNKTNKKSSNFFGVSQQLMMDAERKKKQWNVIKLQLISLRCCRLQMILPPT